MIFWLITWYWYWDIDGYWYCENISTQLHCWSIIISNVDMRTKWVKTGIRTSRTFWWKWHHFTVKEPLKPGKTTLVNTQLIHRLISRWRYIIYILPSPNCMVLKPLGNREKHCHIYKKQSKETPLHWPSSSTKNPYLYMLCLWFLF